MNDPYEYGYVEASVQMPRMGKLLRWRISVDEWTAKPFQRLPSGRELPFLPEEQHRAFDQKQKRRELAARLSGELAELIIKAIESDDTINGYEPGEWARAHSHIRKDKP